MAEGILADVESSGIYQIRNLVNGKLYIGSAKCFRVRWAAHRYSLASGKHHSIHLQRSWDAHGADAFSFEAIELCQCAALIEREQYWLDALKPKYNVAHIAGSTLGLKCTDETKAKISAANRGKIAGRKQSPEQIRKRSQAHIGAKRSAETRAKISAARMGKKLKQPRSAEYRAKISRAHKGRMPSAEHMAALQQGRARQVFSEERRRAVSEALRRGYANGIRRKDRPQEYRDKIAATLRRNNAAKRERERQNEQQCLPSI